MIYIPMLKTRDTEYSVSKDVAANFSENIIPLFEVISEKYTVRYKVDEEGEYIWEQHGKTRRRAKCEPTEHDINTLPYINEIVCQKNVFIDYFRFSIEKYGRNINIKNAELAWNLSEDFELYKAKVLSVTAFHNMIPVVSVKKNFHIPKSELTTFLRTLQGKSEQIALRITEEWIDEYDNILCHVLRKEDYFLFDIEEQNPSLKFMELENIEEYDLKCKVVLLNSPRKASLKNGAYPEHDRTDLIDNSARTIAEEYGLDGYGDYCGLRDVMPLNQASNGKGVALALLYDYMENVFFSYMNPDSSKGPSGYKDIIPVIMADMKWLDPSKDCPGMKKIIEMQSTGKGGHWVTWHYINAVRYIFQTSKYLNK